jgi:3-isopropylmalate/(R)-2-methylmalate dehydratase small subunit
MKITGRVWKFGDNINTDLILPGRAMYFSAEDQAKCVFEANRPGWLQEMEPGDIVIGGENFGTGSSRPAARSLKTIGIAGMAAGSINGLFFRNCVNWGFPALECPDVFAAFEEGETAEIDLAAGVVRNLTRGRELKGRPVPQVLLKTMAAGGVFPLLEAEGLIAPRAG